MRLLSVDFGGKRIGIAVGEAESGISSARTNLAASGSLAKDAEAIAAIAEREEADAVVVGIPIKGSGAETQMAKVCGMLAEKLRERGLRVHTVNEALSSKEAETYLRGEGHKASVRRRLVDGEAARLIFERFVQEWDGEEA